MKQSERGQGLVEYSLVLVLVAIVVIAVLLLIGPAVNEVFLRVLCSAGVTSACSELCDLGYTSYCSENISPASVLEGKANAGRNGLRGLDAFKEFEELSSYQEEALNEARQQLQEATVETFEVLIEYADEIGDEVLYALVLQAQQAASGDYSNLPSAIADVFTALGEAPSEVHVAVIQNVVPYVINAYWVLDGTQVPYEAFEAALQEIEQYPGSTEETISIMWEAWDLGEQRNLLIGEMQPGLLTGACYGITALNNTGIPENIDLAQEYLAQLPPSPCNN